MPGDYTLDLDWPTCSFDNQKCPKYLARCDMCEKKENLMVAEKSWAIVTNDREKVELIINTIFVMCDPGTIEKTVISKDDIIVLFSDGTKLTWYKALIDSVRNMKCSRLWLDKNSNASLIKHINVCYFGEEKDIIWI